MEPSGLISAGSVKRVHVALPVRVSYWNGDVRTAVEMACTCDIHARGARIFGLRNVRHPGELILVERGRNKAWFRVTWIGDAHSGLLGQVGIESASNDKLPWLCELEELDESYSTISHSNSATSNLRPLRGHANRRRAPRFAVTGMADLLKLRGCSAVKGELKEISETGCLLSGPAGMVPGTDLRIDLNIANCELTFRAALRSNHQHRGAGVEFRQLRRGDRPLLESLLRRLAEQQAEDCKWSFESPRPVTLADSESIDYLQ